MIKQLEPPPDWSRFWIGVLPNGKRYWSAGELGIIIETHFEVGMRCPQHHISFSLRSGNMPTEKLCLKMANEVRKGKWEIDNQYSQRKNVVQHLWLEDPEWPINDSLPVQS